MAADVTNVPTARDTAPATWGERLAQPFLLDPRSLALLRILLGLLLLWDVWVRIQHMEAMYTDAGLTPLEVARQYAGFPWSWSPFLLDGSWGWQAAMFAVLAAAAAALALGWQTTLSTIVCWLLLASLHNRVPTVLSGGDTLLRLVLMWSMFMPLGRVWSLDAWRAGGATDCRPTLSAGTVALVIQLALVYGMTALFKLNSDWFGGDALLFALRTDLYGTTWGEALLAWPGLLRAATWATLLLELAGPVLLLCPWGTSWLRLAAVALFGGLHLGIWVFMSVGQFSEASLVAWMAMLPAAFWDSPPVRAVLGNWMPASDASREPSDDGAAQPVAPEPAPLAAARWVPTVVCGLLLAYVTLWNLDNLRDLPKFGGPELAPATWTILPEPLRPIARWTYTQQLWAMFYQPERRAGWWIARGRLADGRQIDLLRDGAPAGYVKPAHFTDPYPDFRWTKMFRSFLTKDGERFLPHAAAYLFRRWNAEHPEERHLVSLDMVIAYEVLEDGPDLQAGDFISRVKARHPDPEKAAPRDLLQESLRGLPAP